MKERDWKAHAALMTSRMVPVDGLPIHARQTVLHGVTIKDGPRTVAVLADVMEADLLVLAGGAKLLGLCEAFLLAHRRFVLEELEAGGMPRHLDEFAEAVAAQVDAMGGGDCLLEPGAYLTTGS